MVGHVDHGKTTLTQALTGRWTDQHSEEQKRGISIKLGYADADFYRVRKNGGYRYTSQKEQGAEYLRTVSFVDAPGHETLMAIMLSGAAIMDAAILLVAANEKCPQPQTREHLSALETMGLVNIVVVQNKIDVCSEQRAQESYAEIREFLAGTTLAEAPVVPVSAHHNRNIDLLIEVIEELFPTPERSAKADFRMHIARSFDINRPGTLPPRLRGGVIGGSLSQGSLAVGDEIEIRPGRKSGNGWEPVRTTVASLQSGSATREVVAAGGLVAIGTALDPAVTKSDSMLGSLVGHPGTLPPVREQVSMEVQLLDRAVGTRGSQRVEALRTREPLMLTVGTSTTVGLPTQVRGTRIDAKLKLPVCAPDGQRIAISRRIEGRWHLIGHGILQA
ncbi:MAG: translation initiation factor IF-2 subunit gamma [Marine Group III euryarchaeote CG-Bathy2]|nr:MAG: translation initiation factor IF-2 subunit gamma [Marine Group III euryarchaeote CG-Bathy2]